MQRKCHCCGSGDVVLISGYEHCASSSRRIDRSAINTIISKFYNGIQMEQIKDLCTEMFGTKDYGWSTFPKVYGILDRGAWIESQHRFEIPSNEYLIKVFHEFIRRNHPRIFERINHE